MSGTPASLNIPVGLVVAGPVVSVILGALIMMVVFRTSGFSASSTPPTAVPPTPTITLTLAPTDTLAPTYTLTPLPPVKVTVKEGDTCLGLAEKVGIKDISLIRLENGKPPNCDSLSIGQVLLIPQPTPTLPPAPTQTQNAAQSTESACPFESYTVVEGDSLMGISDYWDVPPEAIKKWNPQYSFINDQVMIDMKLRIPLCERYPTQGPSPTPTTPPPYPAPNLLTPRDGTIFSTAENDIALQWASVASLRETEEYQVTIEDISSGEAQKTVLYVKDTRVLVPAELKPTDGTVHIFRWSVMVVRRTGANDAGNPLYITAGAASERRVFGWGGTGLPIATSTP